MPPLLPVLLPLVVTAVVLGALFAWWFPAAAPSDELPVVRLNDITAASGMAFVHRQGEEDSPSTLGAGVAVLDYDRDGDADLFFVNGAPWPWEEPNDAPPPASALYRNDGSGSFEDVAPAAGLALTLQGMAAAAGDYDADGWPDLVVTSVGGTRLFRNQGDGTFVETTAAAALGGDANLWTTGAAWLDYDHDGHLDLVVCCYARWPREIELELAFKIAGVGRSYGAPAGFVTASPLLYRNLGDGRFAEVADAAGLRNLDPQTNLPRPFPLAVAPVDADGDGRLDLVFTHQAAEEVLFLNQGDGTFREWKLPSDRREGAAAGLAVTGGFPLAPRIAHGDRFGALRSVLAQPAEAHAGSVNLDGKLGFALLDYESDGRTEVLLGGGRMEPELNRFDHGRAFEADPALLVPRGEAWAEAPAAPGDGGWPPSLTARGVAVADLDGDGDSDVVITQHDGPARVFRNDQRLGAPWLRIDLLATVSAPGAGGARVEVHTPRRVHVQTVAPPMGLFAQSESTLTFGLGDDARVRRVVVQWPSGQRQEVRPEGINRTLRIAEPGRP